MNNLYTSSLLTGKANHLKHITRPFLLLALLLLSATGAWAQNNTIDLSGNFATDVITAHNGDVLTGTLAQKVQISIENNATVTLQNVSINANGSWTSGVYAGITCLGNATIILEGTNTVKGFDAYYPGIYVPTGYTLTIQGSGSLNASSNDYGAGIGGGSQLNCGNIVIAGGTITATGGKYNSGIGAGYGASCGTISITGGTVNATGGLWGSGIGTGSNGSCGAITISGGFVTATGGGNAAGIGAGYDHASCVSIDITGGTVTATGGTNAAGIGTGLASSCGPITITDGVTQVTATKGEDAPNSIGAGLEGECGTVTIGGVVYWENNQYQNNGNDPKTGIVKSPYYYPIPNYTLGEIPSGWTVTADGQTVTLTDGKASIQSGATVVLTPTDEDKPRVKSVTLIDPLTIPLTFEAIEAGAEVTFTKASTLPDLSIEYSLNGGTWTTYTTSITLTNIGDKVSFHGNNAVYAESSEGDVSYFSCTADCYVYGNVMSLIDPGNFATRTELPSDYTFCSLFNNNSHIYNNHVSKTLLLPATTLKEYCYANMFKGCTNLTVAPELPAMAMAKLCYYHMFQGCTSLTAAPALPATSLAGQCYDGMFAGCTNLETAPALPATNLAGYCYSGMFGGCTSLATAPALPATTLESGCYFSMFNSCTSLTTAPTLSAETLANSCYSAMFHGCTSLQTAPALPATTLSDQCYWYMFENCTNLTTAPALPATSLAEQCYDGMFSGCTSLTTAPILPAMNLASSCYSSMFSGCTSLTTAPTLPAMNLASGCYASMFSGCTSLTTAPILPAETLTKSCYSHMFNGCSNLNRVICLATNISAQYCTANWLLDVAQTGTFIKPASMTSWLIDDPSGIPEGWTTTIYEPQPLTFEAKEANATVTFTKGANVTLNNLEYSIDNGANWSTYTFGTPISLTKEGDKVSFRGNNATYATHTWSGRYSYFSCSADCYVYGNIMSLINKENYATTTALTSTYTFCGLFYNNANIYNYGTNALVLPAITLAENCYNQMFYGCTSLTAAPALPAETLASNCYYSMFQGCTSLTAAPALPAKTLKSNCYNSMFRGCTSLETAPELPATTLDQDCYSSMFQGCTSLETAPTLPVETLASYCYQNMFRDCTHLNTAPALPATTLAESCYRDMFHGCTQLTTSPVLPATTLVDHCYDNMFQGCSNLNRVTCLATNFQLTSQYTTCTYNWLYGVAATGTFVKPETMNDWTLNSPSGIPEGWTAMSYEIMITPLTFEAKTAGAEVTFTKGPSMTLNDLEYSTDNGANWSPYTFGTSISLTNEGDKVSFRGNNAAYANANNNCIFSCSASCYLYGNIMSLVDKVDFATNTKLTGTYAFAHLFDPNPNLYSHPSKILVLPATTLTPHCYYAMFEGCTQISKAPALPATGLAESCYSYMFNGCTGLQTVPSTLPATTLAERCYSSMFWGCTSLTTAPSLPATTLVAHCYDNMFYGCTNLNSVTCLATDITAMNCTTGWLSDVAPTGTFYKPATMNGWELNSPNGIPVGWTAIPVVPGKFSVNADGDQIYFSQGNLQATTTDLGANWTWSFATNQWDYIGNAVANTSINGNGTVSTNGTVDLFGWVGASSTWTGAAQYGISNATATSSTDTYGNVEGEALKSDWGTQAISNGGGTANSGWRTLTKDEWEYLLFTRLSGSTVENMMNARYTCATINTDNGSGGVKGLILFPNNITIAQNEVTKWGTINNHSSWDYCTKCTSAQWTALAAKGCVFLPAAGDRFNGTNVSNDGPQGLYWSSSSYTSSADPAYCIKFNSDNLYADYYYRFYGLSVRLVHTTKPMGSLSYAAPTVVKTTADEPFTNPLTLVGDGTVSFAVSAGDDICTVDATGEVTLNGTTGTCIITATVTVPSNSSYAYATTTASYTLTVKTIQQTPLTFEAKVAGAQVTFTINATAAPNGVQYSTDGSTWIDYTSDDAITLTNVGDKVMFRGDNTTYSNFDLNTHSWTESNFSCTKDCYIYGNIMSLISKEGYATATTLTGTRTFCSLFYDNTHIVNHASKTLVLPATTLTEKCYYMMFGNCSGLTTAPDLPATTLANSCYGGMFVNCTGLTTAPELPATTLAEFCYQNMFNGCTNLTTAPTLPATTLAQGCYNMMFYGCSSLTTAPILPATTLVEQCYSCMFYGCSSLTTAPILPATTLVEQCYYSMFQGCSNLNSVTCLATTGINTNSSTDSWLAGVATTGTFTKNASTPTGSGTSGQYWPTGSTSGIPTGWTVTTPEAIPLTFEAKVAGATVTFTINATAAPNGVQYSTDGSTWIDYTSGDAITLTNVGDKVSFRGNNAKYATTSSSASTFSCSSDCYIYGNIMSLVGKENFSTNTTLTGTYTFAGMFTGNADLYNHPFKSIILPATTLANYCYTDMFKNCTSLTAAPALPATTLANYCYTDMFKNCTSLTAAPALPATTLTESCYYEMFADCTGLTEAPDLPATTLAVGCYYSMFSDCTNLVTAPALPATTLAGMCYQLMFAFCTSLTTAPALPATTLVDNCYSYMFYGCTQLNQVTCLATSGINSNNSTTDWLNGVATTGTFYKASGIVVGENGWTPNSASGIPTGWTTEDHVEGALHGKFSVSSTKQVYFSQGNLQATTSDLGTNWTWAFAEHQYDYIGNATGNTSINGNGTVSTNSTVDLFGWSTSSTTFGIHNSTSNSTYNGSFVDWGGNIGTGWRTLTSTEWEYIFKTRNSGSTVNGTSNARYTHATINTGASSVKGMILFPDGVTIDNSEADSWGAINSNSGYATQCTSAQWTALAAKGCVFLPAAGRRSGSSVIWSNSDGCYWSSSPYIMSDYAYYLYFGYSNLGNSDYNNERQLGMSVRLVRDAN